VLPLDNLYLKIFYVLYVHKPLDVSTLIDVYGKTYPEDREALEKVASQTLIGRQHRKPPEIWLANHEFETGTSLFDQFRGLPRAHTFDLNAASLVDLLSIPGMKLPEAERLLEGGPYETLEHMLAENDLGVHLRGRIVDMSAHMDGLMAADPEDAADLQLSSILMPFLWRALFYWVLSAAAAAILYYYARRKEGGWYRAVLNGLAAALLGLSLSWLFYLSGGFLALCVPLAVFGIPGALWQLIRRKDRSEALRVFLAWAAASLPSFILLRPWF
jgi:hypothetical protein